MAIASKDITKEILEHRKIDDALIAAMKEENKILCQLAEEGDFDSIEGLIVAAKIDGLRIALEKNTASIRGLEDEWEAVESAEERARAGIKSFYVSNPHGNDEFAPRITELEIRDGREHLKDSTYMTWQSAGGISASGNLAQDIAEMRAEVDRLIAAGHRVKNYAQLK